MIQTVTIPHFLPPTVANTSRQRHWTKVSREVRDVKTTVWASAAAAGWKYIGDDAPQHRLTVIFVFPNKRRRDVDNLYARAKHVIDGLKPFLIDDNSEHLDLNVSALVSPGITQTILKLEPA